MRDLRAAFGAITKKFGLDVYLQRRIYRTGEGIYSLPTPDPGDQRYWTSTLERYTIYTTFAGRRLSLSNTMEARQEGWIHSVPVLFYFPWNADPTEGDRVYLKDERFPNNLSTFIISYSSAEYGQFGKIAFFTAGALRETPK